MNKTKLVTIAVLALIIILTVIDIRSVNNNQKELIEDLKKRESEITLLRNQNDINEKYPKIIQFNQVAKDYNISIKTFPNNLYNSIVLGNEGVKYLIK